MSAVPNETLHVPAALGLCPSCQIAEKLERIGRGADTHAALARAFTGIAASILDVLVFHSVDREVLDTVGEDLTTVFYAELRHAEPEHDPDRQSTLHAVVREMAAVAELAAARFSPPTEGRS